MEAAFKLDVHEFPAVSKQLTWSKIGKIVSPANLFCCRLNDNKRESCSDIWK